MYGALATGWNIIGGFSGYPSFGNVVFFGLGAYSAGIMMSHFGWLLLPAAVVGIVISAALAAFMWPILRLKGHYFAIATLAVAEAARELIAISSFTGGGTGLGLPIFVGGIDSMARYFYFIMFALLVIGIVVTVFIRRSRMGYALIAIKVDERTAESLGIDTARYKTMAFVISAILTSAVGSVYAYWITFIDPVSVFAVTISVQMIMMALLGGVGTVFGPVAGALILGLISEWAWINFPTIHTAALGIVMVLLILFLPQGLADVLRKRGNVVEILRSQMRSYGI